MYGDLQGIASRSLQEIYVLKGTMHLELDSLRLTECMAALIDRALDRE